MKGRPLEDLLKGRRLLRFDGTAFRDFSTSL